MKFFIDKCIEDYKTFLHEIESLNQSEDEENPIDNKIRRHQLEESFAMSFFIHMNNALFAGEYLDKTYDVKIALFDDSLAQDDSVFSLQIKKAIDHLKTLKTLVNNKINLIGEDLLFSAIKSHNTLDVDKSGFLLKFTNISIQLAMADHFLIYQSKDDVATLLFMLDALGQEINIANEELKSIYLKLYSKCSLLLKKVCYIMDDSHKYALDFKIYDINEKQNIDTYNEEFDALFEGLYQKKKYIKHCP